MSDEGTTSASASGSTDDLGRVSTQAEERHSELSGGWAAEGKSKHVQQKAGSHDDWVLFGRLSEAFAR